MVDWSVDRLVCRSRHLIMTQYQSFVVTIIYYIYFIYICTEFLYAMYDVVFAMSFTLKYSFSKIQSSTILFSHAHTCRWCCRHRCRRRRCRFYLWIYYVCHSLDSNWICICAHLVLYNIFNTLFSPFLDFFLLFSLKVRKISLVFYDSILFFTQLMHRTPQ